MKYRTLSTKIEISELCFGTMRYADKDGTENQRSADGAKALEAAIERGVNFIHSSYEYQTRWLTGPVLKRNPKRHELHHIIKVNVPDWDEPRFSADSFRRQVEQALEELGTDHIAVVQHLQRGVARPQIMSAASDRHRLEQFAEQNPESFYGKAAGSALEHLHTDEESKNLRDRYFEKLIKQVEPAE